MATKKELDMFREKMTTDVAAYLLHKAGGTMHFLKLVQLMYLADRAMFDRYGFSMTGNSPTATDEGLILSATFDLMLGKTHSDHWSGYFAPISDGKVSLLISIEPMRLGELSRGTTAILEDIFERYGLKSLEEVCEATRGLAEWEDPQGVSKPVEISAILAALGKNAKIIKAILEDLQDRDALERTLTSL